MLFNRHLYIQSAQRDESPCKETSHGDKIRDNHMRRLSHLLSFLSAVWLEHAIIVYAKRPASFAYRHRINMYSTHTHTHAKVLCVYLLYRYDSNRPSNMSWNRMKVFVECKVFSPPSCLILHRKNCS